METGLWPPFGGRTHVLALGTLGALAALVYANSFHAGFTFDNAYLILGDARVHAVRADYVRQIFAQDYWAPRFVMGNYRPLTTLSFLFNYAVLGGGEDPVGYHVLNLLLHWGNAALVYCLALAVLRDAWAAVLTAALFTAHPIATEAVTNIVGRADLLATLSVLGGTLLYLKGTQTDGWGRAACLLGLALGATLGLLAKESAFGILGAMLAFDLTYRLPRTAGSRGFARRGWNLVAAGYVALVPAFATVAWLRARVYRGLTIHTGFLENPLVGADGWSARLTALKVLGRYVWHLAWPAALSCDYSYDAVPLVEWPPAQWQDWQGYLALAGVVATVAALARWGPRNRPLLFFALFFAFTFLPVSNLALTIGTIMADRLIYLPSVGFAGAVVAGVSALLHRRVPAPPAGAAGPAPSPLARLLLALLVAAYGVRAFARNADWQDDVRLFESAARAAPGSFKVHQGLAAVLAAVDSEYAQLDRIIAEEERALAIITRASLPPEARSWSLLQSLGEHYATQADRRGAETAEGRRYLERAAETLEESAAVNQARGEAARGKSGGAENIAAAGAPGIYADLGDVYLALAAPEKAAETFRHLSRLAPDRPEAHVGLARVHLARGALDEAAVSLMTALTLDGRRQDAWALLVQVYERADPGGCAVTRHAGGAAIEWNCPLVHAHVCMADVELIRLFLAARQPQAAHQLAERAVRQQCPRGPIDAILPRD